MYKDIARKSRSTGFGITPKDQVNGVDSTEAKLENMCPYLKKMDELFGGRENVWPRSIMDSNLQDDNVCASDDKGIQQWLRMYH